MTFLYPNPVLQMKHSSWRINLYVICRSGYKSRCKPCVQRWSSLADWKLLMLQKGFSHSFWCTRDTKFFLSLTVFAFEGKENALLFCHHRQLFFQAAIIFATNFCELIHRKTFVLPIDCCFWKKVLKIESWKKAKSFAAKKSCVWEDFLDFSIENRKFRRYCILSLFGQSNHSKEFSKQLSLSESKVYPLKRNIKDR